MLQHFELTQAPAIKVLRMAQMYIFFAENCVNGGMPFQARVEQWIDFSTLSIDGPSSSWTYPLLMPQVFPYDKKVYQA